MRTKSKSWVKYGAFLLLIPIALTAQAFNPLVSGLTSDVTTSNTDVADWACVGNPN